MSPHRLTLAAFALFLSLSQIQTVSAADDLSVDELVKLAKVIDSDDKAYRSIEVKGFYRHDLGRPVAFHLFYE